MISPKFVIFILWLLLTGGCASQSDAPDGNQQIALAYELLHEQRQYPRSYGELKQLNRLFQKFDELQGIWETALYLSEFKGKNLGDAAGWAQLSLDTAKQLNDKHAVYQSLIAVYQTSGKPEYLTQAKEYASTEYQLNQYYFLSNQWQAIQLRNVSAYSKAQLAYTLYWLARQCHCEGRIDEAYDLFKQTENAWGMADALFFRAQLFLEQGNKIQAQNSANRALRSFVVLKAVKRIQFIERWKADNELDR